MPESSHESTVIQAVAAYLSRLKGSRCRLLRVTILAKGVDGITSEETLKIPACLQLPPQGQTEDASEAKAREEAGGIKEDIVKALEQAGKPLKAAAIARRIGKSNSGYFRQALASLKREGIIEPTDNGYRLSVPPSDEDTGTGEA